MTRIPPIVLPMGALLALVVAFVGLAMNWAEATPVAFFVFVFCTILATIQLSLATMEPYVPPTVEVAPNVAMYDAGEQDEGEDVGSRHMEEISVAHDDVSQVSAADDEHPRQPA